MAKPGATGLIRVIHATGYSMKGLSSAWRHEAAFRQELLLILLLTPLAFVVGKELLQTLFLLVLAWSIVVVEILNSAIEAVVDRIGHEHHELSGRAKDLGSAAVFITLMMNLVAWGALTGRNLLHLW
ncbi:diacylglycerol kinase [Aeromonas media]|uniref:diacylglycerol kinase n=1 Tax=Aeromonas TaxID=642 RepID=UPI0024C12922|nr:diacylglycerol kinase [Aeromonas media]MDM5075320.1 diacylglycerol kinase [Aeromonas media]